MLGYKKEDVVLNCLEIKDKLRNLSYYLPRVDFLVYQFGTRVANHLKKCCTASIFLQACDSALNEMDDAINERARSKQDSIILLRGEILAIAKAVLPPRMHDQLQELVVHRHQKM